MTDSALRILVLGNGGSGKTTLANKISQQLNIPLLHLDQIYWQQGWQWTDRHSFCQTVNRFMQQEAWIIEGTPMYALDERLQQANVIIFLDVSRWLCLFRVLKKGLLRCFYQKKLIDGCPVNAISLKALRWVYAFPNKQKKQLLEKIEHSKKPAYFLSATSAANFSSNSLSRMPASFPSK